MKQVFVLWLKNEDLKPCPFCGGKARLGLVGEGEFRAYGVRCRSCGAGGRTRVQKRSAVNHWNKRADAKLVAKSAERIRCPKCGWKAGEV